MLQPHLPEANTAVSPSRMWCSAQDVAATFAGLSLWLAAVRASGHLASASLTVAPTPAFVLTALSVSSSYIVYSLVWFNAAKFAAACQRAPLGLLGVDAVGVFQTLVLAFKLGQQLALLLWAAHAAGADASSPHAVVHALATLLVGLGPPSPPPPPPAYSSSPSA